MKIFCLLRLLLNVFFNKKRLENEPFNAKNAKMEEKGKLYGVIFLNKGHLNQNKDDEKPSK